MTQEEIKAVIEQCEEMFVYHVRNADSATAAGSQASAERSLSVAADHAAILTALKGMLT